MDVTGQESYICTNAASGAAAWDKTTVGTISEVAGLQTALDNKAVSHSGLWTPEALARAIDLNFEWAALGALSSIPNTGSLGGNAAQTAVAERPLIVDVNGRRGAQFDGISSWLESSASWALGAAGFGIFAVFKYTSGDGYLISEEYTGADGDVLYTMGYKTGTNLYFGHFNGAWKESNTVSTPNGSMVIAVGNFDGVNQNIRLFGVDNKRAETSFGDGTTSLKTRIGRRWDGALGAASNLSMTLFRVIVKSGAFTAAEIEKLESWAQNHYGEMDKFTIPQSKVFSLGTAASKNAPATGNAGTGEVVLGADTRLSDSRTPATHTHDYSTDITGKPIIPPSTDGLTEGTTNLYFTDARSDARIALQKAQVNGVASLDAGGRVPQAQLPTLPFGFRLIDPADIIAAANLATFLFGDDLTAGAVAAWPNSGTGTDFAQATTGSQPVAQLVPSLGGRMAVLADGVDDWMDTAHIDLGANYAIFAVIRTPAVIPALNSLISGSTYPNYVEYALNTGLSGFEIAHYNGAWRQYFAAAPAANTSYMIAGMYDGANLSFSINGAVLTATAQTSNPNTSESNSTRLFRRWDGTVTAANVFSGHLAAMVCKSGAAFTADELNRLFGWAAWYYGMAGALPAAHTYKNHPPLIAA